MRTLATQLLNPSASLNQEHRESECKSQSKFPVSFWRETLPQLLSSLVLVLLISASTYAQSITPSIRGYLKELGLVSLSNDFKTVHYDNILHNRLETNLDFNNGLQFQVDIRNRLLAGFTIENTPGYAEYLDNDPGFVDMSWILFDFDRALFHSTIDRLQLSYYNGPWEVTLGRQRINWGKTYVWNPNDLFNSYAFLDFDYEERPGTDAVSASYNWSYASSISGGYRFGDSLDESVIALMYRGNLGNYDIQAIAGNYLRKIAFGAGWAGYLKSAGFNGEITYFHPREDFFEEKGYVTATAGSDYMFPNSVYLSGELMYNGGYNHAGGTAAQLLRPPSADNLFISKTGFYVNGSTLVSPLTNVSLGLLGSFTDPVYIIIPQISYSLTENTDILLLAQLLKGDTLSESTTTPNVVYFRIKWSF